MIANEIIFGVIFIIVSIFLFLMTFRFPDIKIALSPAVFPRFVTITLFIISSILLAQGIKKQVKGWDKKQKIKTEKSYFIRFILLFATGFIYTRFISITGYIVATPVFIAATMLIFDEKKIHRIVLFSIVVTAVLYTVFRIFFRIPLPRFTLR